MSNSRNLKVINVVMAVLYSGLACAGNTVEDIAALQAELARAELQKKIDEAKAHNKDAAPVATPQPALAKQVAYEHYDTIPREAHRLENAVKEADVIAIYGVGGNLNADVQYNGALYTLSKTSPNFVGNWKLLSITPNRVKFIGHGGAQHEISLSLPEDTSKSGTSSFGAGAGGVPVPPLAPSSIPFPSYGR
jgi:type IV pilus biogenesis protein PilP